MIYRTENYQKLKATVEKFQKKVDKKKEVTSNNTNVKEKKRIDRYEEVLKTTNQELGMVRMKSMFAVAFAMITILGVLNSV